MLYNLNMTNFKLIETILWENGDYFLLEKHLDRLLSSATFFNYTCDIKKTLELLESASISFNKNNQYKIRLLCNSLGDIEISVSPLQKEILATKKITISNIKIDENDIFLKHKTTNRKMYDMEFEKCRQDGYFDVIFFNTKGELTEGSITNIILMFGNEYFTPPISVGVLPGVYRDYLLEKQPFPLKEKVLTLEDLNSCDKILLINSVRKSVEVTMN